MANPRETEVDDLLGEDDEIQPDEYNISSYGADYPVELLVRRLKDGELYTPGFQRSFVWDIRMASRFVESLLLGLPVPGIFISKEPALETYLIIDGQQRLKSLEYFAKGIFEPKDTAFKLKGVQKRFTGLTYDSLPTTDRRRLDNAIIHTTIIKQDEPKEDQSGVYHIFERLNSGGKQLLPQEIRSALFHGPLVSLLKDLNEDPNWRAIYGAPNQQQRDQELILRFLAFVYYEDSYAAPMKVFLNRYMGRNRNLVHQSRDQIETQFRKTIELAHRAFGAQAFRPQRALNAAVFDSVMVALAKRLQQGVVDDIEQIRTRYIELMADENFTSGITRATANEQRVRARFSAAEKAFEDVG